MAVAKNFKSPPIVHSARNDVRDAVRQELKALGADNTLTPAHKDECIELLIKNPESVLVIDWECGAVEVTQILGACKGHFHVETRPSFLIVAAVEPSIVATGYEYGISQIHSGAISRQTIRECLEALLREDKMGTAVKEVLVRVAQARSRGDWALATPLLAELFEGDKDDDRIAVELAENLIYEENWEQAAATLKPFVERDPPVVRALHLMGRCLMHQGDYDAAIGLLGRAKIINPHNVDRLIDLGHAFLNNDQVDEAMANFDEAAAIDGKNKAAVEGKGQCLLMSGDINEALGLLKAVSGPREMASIFNTAAVLSMRADRFEKGLTLYRSALAALGRNDQIASRLYFNMGVGFKRWNKLDKAIAAFTKSYELDKTYAKAARHKEMLEKKLAQAPAAKPSKAAAPDFAEQFQEEVFSGVKSTQVTPTEEIEGLEDDDHDVGKIDI
jgi:tetratricopeptide (TPR) repeat protein